MIRELTKGIDKYLSLKKTGNENKLVKNKDQKGRFINAKVWDWSPEWGTMLKFRTQSEPWLQIQLNIIPANPINVNCSIPNIF